MNSATEPSYAVWHRPGPGRPWSLIAWAETAQAARCLMYQLMDGLPPGDGAGGPVPDPPSDRAGALTIARR